MLLGSYLMSDERATQETKQADNGIKALLSGYIASTIYIALKKNKMNMQLILLHNCIIAKLFF